MLLTPLFGSLFLAGALETVAKLALVVVLWSSTRASRIKDESVDAELEDITLMVRRPALWALKNPVRFARRHLRSMIGG